jgi:hypothetical protein
MGLNVSTRGTTPKSSSLTSFSLSIAFVNCKFNLDDDVIDVHEIKEVKELAI